MTRFFCAFIFLLCATTLFSQTEDKSFTVKHISDAVVVDGVLDEPF